MQWMLVILTNTEWWNKECRHFKIGKTNDLIFYHFLVIQTLCVLDSDLFQQSAISNILEFINHKNKSSIPKFTWLLILPDTSMGIYFDSFCANFVTEGFFISKFSEIVVLKNEFLIAKCLLLLLLNYSWKGII